MTSNSPSSEPQPGKRRRKGRSRNRSAKTTKPVPIHKRSASHFQPEYREEGAAIVAEGGVSLEIDGTRSRARVEDGTGEYAVGVDWSRVGAKRALHGFCECQRFAQGTPCEHLWSVLLALGEMGLDRQPPGRDRVSLRKDRIDNWGDLALEGAPDAASEIRRPGPGRGGPRTRKGRKGGDRDASWRAVFDSVRGEGDRLSSNRRPSAPAPGIDNIRFLVNTAASLETGGLVLDLFGTAGSSKKLKRASVDPEALEQLLRPAGGGNGHGDAEAMAVVAAFPYPANGKKPRGKGNQRGRRGRRGRGGRRGSPRGVPEAVQSVLLPQQLHEPVLSHLSAEGSLGWWDGRRLGKPSPVSWDAGTPWRVALRLELGGSGNGRLRGALERDGDSVPLTEATLLLTLDEAEPGTAANGLVLHGDTLARLEAEPDRGLPWIDHLRTAGEIVIPKEELEEALTSLMDLPTLPRLETADGLEISERRSPPTPRLLLEPVAGPDSVDSPLLAELTFEYDGVEVDAGDERHAIVDLAANVFVRRDMELERNALVRLLELGLEPVAISHSHGLQLDPRELPAVAEPLLLDGWTVEVRGRSLRPPGPSRLRVESGIDWFELRGDVDFEGDRFEMKELLAAISRGDRFVELQDGSRGLLPAAWMETYGSLARLAHDATEEGLRFLPSQALFVDALLTALPPANVDAAFAALRSKLRSFDSIKAKKEPRGFQGELRGYQREGLGWLEFLRDYGLGGVLADDMGLGKTVQVLALIRAHRTASKTTGLPFLVVAPRSLVYNWLDEAKRFTPGLKVVEYLGVEREELKGELSEYDVVVTTYGTLRRDAGYLATVELDTVILDEAQAIKNPESQTAKASRLLVARHRLALTGTPIENHLGELGSIFEFLNPGLLGRLPKLDVLASGGAPTRGQLQLVTEGLRPFILRRTKSQVLKDLPPKTEQVLYCSLRQEQRKLYDQLRATYQESLLAKVESEGLGGSTMQVLEALLRLRQIACHPGLVTEEWEGAGSAKLEALFDQVTEILDEGHKVIVFSQFTKLLGFVRRGLDEQGVDYAYLDGQTRRRGDVVERFQTDPACNLFLISLKAGGLGLNLTAAGYVFLLDPWWNPAVEAQAIDRAHRIGQTQPVFAYRMISRDTVEEKIVELQRSKRQLAEAVLEGGGQSLGELTADDLRMLLS